MAKQRVREQIEQDRLARKAKFGGGAPESPSQIVEPEKNKPSPSKPAQPQQNYSEVQLQIRLTNGAALRQKFGAKEPLSSVKLYVEMNRTDGDGPFSLMTSFPPKKVFAQEDYDKPLDLLGMVAISYCCITYCLFCFLGLAPSAVLIVTKGQA